MSGQGGNIRLILGDQLTHSISSLNGIDIERDVVLMVEVSTETTYVPHHKQKIAFILSAMRHFAAELVEKGIRLDYVKLDDPENTGSFSGEVERAIKRHRASEVIVTEPGEYRVRQFMEDWQDAFGISVFIRNDTRFFSHPSEFSRWAEGKKQLRMEFFYREMRRKTGLLMDGTEPIGGQWNFDSENRKALPKGMVLPDRFRFGIDDTTRGILEMVGERFGHHPGDLEPFGWPVTRRDALAALDHFIQDCLPSFGDVQDAMKQGEGFLFHALLSPMLNVGLLRPDEVCRKAEAAYHSGHAPLNAVEGFIRQILGWREYVRGLYWLKMPDYAQSNALNAHRPLPAFYWTGDTPMNCLKQCVGDTMRNAYAHHIQRLMVLGNFALLAGIAPHEVEEWFLAVYADAFEWVELPNVHGMALFADGGIMASKPYAASGAYIDRMSDYCTDCAFSPKEKLGPKACPFNYLYWDFLARNRPVLGSNQRLAMPYRTLAVMPFERREAISEQAQAFLEAL
jgi:deoxyribodipyrimidine photolyase-related protein